MSDIRVLTEITNIDNMRKNAVRGSDLGPSFESDYKNEIPIPVLCFAPVYRVAGIGISGFYENYWKKLGIDVTESMLIMYLDLDNPYLVEYATAVYGFYLDACAKYSDTDLSGEEYRQAIIDYIRPL